MACEAENRLSAEPTTPKLECEAELRLADLTPDFLNWLERLGPFGNGNGEPRFVSHGLRLTAAFKVVKDRHLRLTVEDPDAGAKFGGMAWSRRTNWAEYAAEWGLTTGSLVDLAYRLNMNRHPDFGGWELEIVDMRPALSQG
jgi:single-stranded-DNA-specific exonuclease